MDVMLVDILTVIVHGGDAIHAANQPTDATNVARGYPLISPNGSFLGRIWDAVNDARNLGISQKIVVRVELAQLVIYKDTAQANVLLPQTLKYLPPQPFP